MSKKIILNKINNSLIEETNDAKPKVVTEDLGKIFEMAICLLYNTQYVGKFKYSMSDAEKLRDKITHMKTIFPQNITHTAEKGARYDFTCKDTEGLYLSAKSTKKGDNVCPQVIGQPSKKKFCQHFGIDNSITILLFLKNTFSNLYIIMEKHNFFFYIFIGFILFFCLVIYYQSDAYNLKCIIASEDGNRYCVREREKLELAANLLAKVTQKMKDMVEYMKSKHPEDPRTKRLVEGFNPKSISETLPTSELTAYSENKGEKIAFCLNTTEDGNKLIDINTLTFVALHELSHIMTESIGHKQEFWENFKFLLQNAKESGVYDPIDYKKAPQEYCGMTINDNPYYDLV